MTGSQQPPLWLEEKIQATSDHATPDVCRRCGAPVLRARIGRVAAIDATTDATPISLTEEIQARLAGLLTWRLIPGSTVTPARITDRHPTVIPHHAYPVLREHRCPESEPTQ
ncbi:hypothetical protein [Streptomyces macrosporus]|uniref:Uncharacterized protein n=1 Tax=Streptomyces macrosporus TaxID=44032 RepID=A0ABN3KF30_9ACTN